MYSSPKCVHAIKHDFKSSQLNELNFDSNSAKLINKNQTSNFKRAENDYANNSSLKKRIRNGDNNSFTINKTYKSIEVNELGKEKIPNTKILNESFSKRFNTIQEIPIIKTTKDSSGKNSSHNKNLIPGEMNNKNFDSKIKKNLAADKVVHFNETNSPKLREEDIILNGAQESSDFNKNNFNPIHADYIEKSKVEEFNVNIEKKKISVQF